MRLSPEEKAVLDSIAERGSAIVERAVEEGLAHGLRRASKYADAPSDELILREVEWAVMLALDEVIDFGGGDE